MSRQHLPSRYNSYALVHKGLRAFMMHTLSKAGTADWQDGDDCANVLMTVRHLADTCRSHLQHENQFIHKAMEARQPGSARHGELDHHEHEQAINGLLADCDRIERSTSSERNQLGAMLYDRLALFIAENLEHMAMEEVDHNAVLWRHYSDAEIHAIEQALVASIAPEKAMHFLRWMLTAATPAERADKLRGMRAHMPPEVFMGVLAMLQPLLSATDWHKLQLALELSSPFDGCDPAELDAFSNQRRSYVAPQKAVA
ncbi:MAG TPA: hypothetical protein VFV64_16015 [Permianibacter sp.]|nr:hypothetical protein [Permianibacter sp.]